MEPTESNDPNLRAFDALMRDAFPPVRAKHPEGLTADERALLIALSQLDHALCELRDIVAEMRASLAELRHNRIKREGFKP